MNISLQRKVSDLKKGDRMVGDPVRMPGPSSMGVMKVTITGKTAKVVLDTYDGLGYCEVTLKPDDMVFISVDKYKFIEKSDYTE